LGWWCRRFVLREYYGASERDSCPGQHHTSMIHTASCSRF
jgi:hypothetical protein